MPHGGVRVTLLLIVLSPALVGVAAHATPDFAGQWSINEDASDDPHDQLTGLALIKIKPLPSSEEQQHSQVYAEQALVAQRHSLRAEADVGELAHVLNTATLTIATTETGFQFTYDNGFKRVITPRPGGAVYTAKGDEFIVDELGRSMVYWRGATLVIETLLAPRGMMTEEVSLPRAKHQLKVHTKLTNPDWDFDADILRVFDPAKQ